MTELDQYIAHLKSKIPPQEHGALESRVEQLLNDPNADENDVLSAIRQEFDS